MLLYTSKFKLVSRGCKRVQVHQLLANCKPVGFEWHTTEDKHLVRCWTQRLLREGVWRRAEGWQMKGGQGWREIWEWRCPTSWWMCFNPANKISTPWKEKFRHTIFSRSIWVLSYFLRSVPAGHLQTDSDSWLRAGIEVRPCLQWLLSAVLSHPLPAVAVLCTCGTGITLIRDQQDTRTCHSEAQGLCWGIWQPLSHYPHLICLHLPPCGSGCHSFNGKLNYHQWPASSVRTSPQQTQRHGERRCHARGKGRCTEEVWKRRDFVLHLMHSQS